MKIGDKVRFLSEVGGGIVRGFQGKDIALVEGEDGFEIPMLIKECVVIQTDDYNIPLKSVAKPAAPAVEEEEPEDDGFLEALDSSATDDWENDESLKEGAENEETTSNI